jgi:hypothetical protein
VCEASGLGVKRIAPKRLCAGFVDGRGEVYLNPWLRVRSLRLAASTVCGIDAGARSPLHVPV